MKRIISLFITIVMILSLGLVVSSCSSSDSGNGNRRQNTRSDATVSTGSVTSGITTSGATSQSGTASGTTSKANSQSGTASNGGTTNNGGTNNGGTNNGGTNNGGTNNGGTNNGGSNNGGTNNGGSTSAPSGFSNLSASEIAALTNTGTVSIYTCNWEHSRPNREAKENSEEWWNGFEKYFKDEFGGEVNFISCEWANWERTYFTDFAAGTAPDIVYLYEKNWPSTAMKGYIYSIDELEAAGVECLDNPALDPNKTAIQGLYTYDNKVYAFADCQTQPDMMFVNVKLFNDLGVKSPVEYYNEGKWNMSQFIECASQVTRDTDGDGKNDTFGYYTWDQFMIIGANAGEIVEVSKTSDALRCAVSDAATVKGLEYLSELYSTTKGGYNGTDARTLFQGGKIGMRSWMPRNEMTDDYNIKSYGFDWDVIPMPLGENNKENVRTCKSYAYSVSKSANTKEKMQGAVNLIIAANSYTDTLGNTDPVHYGETVMKAYYGSSYQRIADSSKNLVIPVHSGIDSVSSYSSSLIRAVMTGSTVKEAIETYKPQIEAACEYEMENKA